MSRFLRICAFLFVSLISTNLFAAAAGYTCSASTKKYTACDSGYFMTSPDTDTFADCFLTNTKCKWDGTVKESNNCVSCDSVANSNAIACPGGTDAPVYQISLNTTETYTTGTLLYSNSAGFCTGNVSNATECKAGGSTVITKMPGLPTKTGYEFKGYYTSLTGGTQVADANGNILVDAATLSGPQTWYAQFTIQPMTKITLDANLYASETATSGTAPSTGVLPRSLYYFKDTGAFTGNSPTTTRITQLTTLPAQSSGTKFLGFYTGKAGTGTKIVDASGNILFENIVNAGLYTTAGNATWYAHYQMTCVPLPISVRRGNQNYLQAGIVYMKPGEPLVYSNAGCTSQITRLSTAILNSIKNALSGARIAGLYLGVEPSTAPSPFNANNQNQNLVYVNRLDSDYMAGTDYARKGYNYPADADDAPEFANPTARARNFMFNTSGALAYPNGHPSLSVLGPDAPTPIYVWGIMPPQDSTYTTLTQLPDVTGAITGSTGNLSGRFKYETTCPSGYVQKGEPGTAYSTCTNEIFTIAYSGDNQTSGSAPTSPTACAAGDDACVAPANTYTKTGHSFAGWTCTGGNSDCDGDVIQPGDSLGDVAGVGGAITLTAKWIPNIYTVNVTNLYGAGYVVYKGTTYNDPDSFSFPCQYGEIITLPEWGENNTLIRDGYVFAGWYRNSFTCASNIRVTPNWVPPRCTAGTGTASTELLGVIANTAYCSCSSQAGYYCPSQMAGEQGVAAVTVNATPCPNGKYCQAGLPFPEVCPIGSYSESASASTRCIVCSEGTTTADQGTGPDVGCTATCPNSDNVSTWATPSWDADSNTVTNTCSVSTCNETSILVNNTCGACTCVAGDNSTCTVKSSDQTNQVCIYEVTCNPGYHGITNIAGAPGVANNTLPACTANTYTVKYNANGGTGTMTDQTFTYNVEDNLTPNAFERTGYRFQGWSLAPDSNLVTYSDNQRVQNMTKTDGATINLYAVWAANCNAITLNPNNGTAGTTATLYKMTDNGKWYTDDKCTDELQSDDHATLIPTRNGYTFRGFYLASSVADVTTTQTGSCASRYITHGGSTTSDGNEWKPSASATLMAGWAKNCAPGTNATCTLTIDQCVKYETSCATGYDISSNGGYRPTCSAHPYTITYNLMGGTNNASNPATYTIETATITLANPTRANSTFEGWYTESSYTNKITQIVKGSTGNKPVYAKWTCNTGYTENSAKTACNPNVTGAITLDSTQYASSTATSGTAATTAATPTPLYIKYNTGVYSNSAATTSVTKITAPVLKGHSFLGFYTGKAGTGDLVVNPDGTFVNNIQTKYSSAGTTATWHAHYEPWTYTIVYNAWKPTDASSTLVGENIEEENLTYGEPVTFKTPQDTGFELTGYDLMGWATSKANAATGGINYMLGQTKTPNIPEDKYVLNLYPVWSAKRITLNWNESGGEAIDNGSCIYDTTFTLPAAPIRDNYTFRAWQLANLSEQFPTTTHPCTVASFGAIDANNTAHGVKALWNGEKAIVTFKTGDTLLNTKQYEYGIEYTLPDINQMSDVPADLTNASYGWTFVGWSTDVNSTSAEYANKASVSNLTGAITLYAVWKRTVKFTYYNGSTAAATTTGHYDQYYRNTTDTAAGVTSITTPSLVANTTYGWTPVQWKLNDTSNSSTSSSIAPFVSPAVNTRSPHYYALSRRPITLSYNGNGSTGGSVDSSTNYQYNNAGHGSGKVTFTVASNGFEKTGHTFTGWTTTANGTAEFQPGDTYTYTSTWTGSSTATLYAKWSANSYTLTLNNMTATSAVGVRQLLYTIYDDGVYLDSAHSKRMKTNGNPIAQLPTRQYTITYSNNGSTSTDTAKYNFAGYATDNVSGLTNDNTAINSQGYLTSVGLAAAKSYTDNDQVWAANWDDAGCVSLRTPADRENYTFAGWYTSEDFTDSSFVGKANATYCPTRTITLYGKWEPNVYKVTLADSVLDTTHNTIYEKYNTGWYSNAGATTKITSVPKPTRSGIDPHTGNEIDYVFLGYFATPQEDVNSTHHAPASLQRVDKDGNILPSNTSLTGDTTWYAAWAEPCAKVAHGTCDLKVYSDGSTEYTGECEEGYIPNGYGGAHPTCGGQMVTLVSDFTFHGETLKAGREVEPKVIYLKPYDGYYTTPTGSTAVTDLTTLPGLEHTCFTFNGFYTDKTTTSIKRINADGTFVDNYEFLPSGPEGAFLYAGYTPLGFNITYDLNGGEEVDDGELNVSQTYGMCSFKMGDCHANQGSKFKKDGYTLTGWKCYGGGTTACDGSDDDIYAPGAVITHVSNSCAHNPTFVAQWKPIESTITLDKNNVGSTNPNTGNGIIYTKYDWGAYLDSALTDDMSQTLRPIIIPVKKFTVKYNANNDGTSPSTSNVAYTFNGYYSRTNGVNKYIDERGYITTAGINEAKATVTPGTWYANWTSKSIDLPNVTRTGYQFNGWYKCSDTNQTIITSPFTPTENTELCAKWTPNTYTVTFNANDANDDATGTMDAQPMTYDVPAALTAEGFTNPGCKFTGWATSASGDVVYNDQQTVSNLTATQNGTVDLYAKWDCMTASASNKTLTYNGTSTKNGTAQGCRVVPIVSNAPSNITVTYSVNKNSGFSAVEPSLTNVGSGTIYYKVSATGYDDLIGSYTCTMQAKNMTVVANNITLPYTDEPQACANVKVTDPTDGKVTYSESANGPFDGSTPSMLNAGTKTIYYQVTGDNYNTKTGSYTCTIAPIDNPISLSATSGSVAYGATTTFNVTENPSGGTLSVSTSNSKVATATINGTTVTVTGVGYDTNGTATITVTSAETRNYLSASATYTVTVNTGTILLKNTATTAGTTTIYTKYNTGVYNDSARQNAMSTTANGITIPAKAGYVFNGYYSATSGGTQYIDANGKITSNGLTAGKGYKTNGTWHAQWSQASCTVGTGVASATASVTNNTVTCAVTCSTGYSQTGGTNTTTTFNNIGSVNVATVANACSPRTFDIEYDGNTNTGGSAPTSPVSCTYDKACPAPANTFTKTGYTFTGWKCTGGTSACDGDIISAGGSLKNVSTGSKITLTAQWEANEYDVTYSCGDGTGTAPNPATATYDADFTPAANTCSKTGYTFNGWLVSGTTERKAPGVAFKWQYTEDKTLTALWLANNNTKYVVNHYTKNLGAATYTLNSTENKTGTSDSSLTLANLKKSIDGFTYSEGFAGTATKGTTKPTSGAVTSTTILANGTRVIDLYYNRVITTITVSKNSGSGSLTVNGTTATGTTAVSFTCEYGATFTLPAWDGSANALALTNKVFTGWDKTGTITCGTADQTITAQWTTPTCTAGTGVKTTSLKEVTNNAPVCNRSSNGGYYCSKTQTGTPGATNLTTTCAKADAGYYATAGATGQTKCPAGKYTDKPGRASCSTITDGCYGTNGATSSCPNNCNALTPAVAVTGGTYSSITPRNASTQCRYVAPTKTADGCSTVTANTVSYTGSAWESGYYTAKADKGYRVSATNTATPACAICACGTYQGITDSTATECTKTDAGYYAGEGAATQTKTDAGYYAAAGACTQTKINQGCFGGEGSSVACPNQCPAAETGWTLTSTTGLKVVTDCTETTTPATSGSPIATICTAGTLTKKATSTTAWGNATASGLKAKSGRYVNGLTCSACAAGSYQGTNGSTATACTLADAGYYVPSAESDKQTACPAGTYQGSTGKTSCTDATAGTYTTGCKITSNSTACTGTSVCATNTYSNDKASTCTACATDKGYGNSGSTASNHAGVASCKVTCSAGTAVLTANNACATIQNSTYKGKYTTEHSVNYGSKTEIQTCPAYYQDGNGTTAQSNCINACSAGTQVASANADCTTPNTANWYTDAHNVTYGKTSSNMSKVIDCATDKGYGNSGTSASNHAGSTSCKTTCAAGKMVLSANAECTTPSNTTYGASWYTAQHTVAYGSTSKGLSLVKSCPTSSYVTPNNTTQSNHNDSTDCTITCAAGTVVASSNANCTTPSGSWYSTEHTVIAGNTSNSTQKQSCVNGYATPNNTTKSNHDASTDCTITCDPGEYVAAANGLCENVGAGYYFAGGKVSQGSKNTRGQCTAPLTTIGYGYGANEAADCGRILHAGSNTIYLRSAERSSPSLRVKVGDKTFYGALSTSLSGALKVKKDNVQYSVVNDWQ